MNEERSLTKKVSDPERSLTKREKRALAKVEKASRRRKKETTKRFKNWFIGLLVIIGLFYGGYRLWQWINIPTEIPQDILEIKSTDWIKGNPDAELTLIDYADFRCSACAAYSADTKRLVEEFPKDLRYVFRHFPLVSLHEDAIDISRAAEAAGVQGKFWEMHDLIFQRQSEWEGDTNPVDKFISFAKELGLDEEKYKQDLDNKELNIKINDDLASANQLRLNATPTFFLNGERMKTPRNYDEFKSLIEQALSAD